MRAAYAYYGGAGSRVSGADRDAFPTSFPEKFNLEDPVKLVKRDSIQSVLAQLDAAPTVFSNMSAPGDNRYRALAGLARGRCGAPYSKAEDETSSTWLGWRRALTPHFACGWAGAFDKVRRASGPVSATVFSGVVAFGILRADGGIEKCHLVGQVRVRVRACLSVRPLNELVCAPERSRCPSGTRRGLETETGVPRLCGSDSTGWR
jgi:hypothetical protein